MEIQRAQEGIEKRQESLVERAKNHWRLFEEAKREILGPSDFVTVRGERRPRKSAFRKLALCFGVSDEIVGHEMRVVEEWVPEEDLRDGDVILEEREGKVVRLAEEGEGEEKRKRREIVETKLYRVARKVFVVKARATWGGRTAENLGAVSSDERGFARSWHDPLATAATRAINRAISDMIAGGEVSAEELASPEELRNGLVHEILSICQSQEAKSWLAKRCRGRRLKDLGFEELEDIYAEAQERFGKQEKLFGEVEG